MRKSRSRKIGRDGAAIAASLMLAPMVVSMRLPIMLAEGRGGVSGTETMLALTEKNAAMARGVFAAQASLIQSASLFWPEVLSGRTPSIFNGVAVERSVNAALKPAGQQVKANFRRLTAKV